MRSIRSMRYFVVLLLLGSLLDTGAMAQRPMPSSGTGEKPARHDQPKGEASPAAAYFTDTVLVNQDGQKMRFYSDLLKGKVVVINAIFTTCTGICPVMSKTLARVQDHLKDQLGKNVRFISISVDPENDSPQKLKDFGANFGARPGWYFLTGQKENVEFILQRLGQKVDVKENHNAIMLIGNEPSGLWKKAFGLAGAEDIIAIVESVIQDSEGNVGSK